MAKSYADWTEDELEAAASLMTLKAGKPAAISFPHLLEPESHAIALEEIRALRQEQQALLGQVAAAVTQLGTAVAAMQETSGRLVASSGKEVRVSVGAPKGLEECVAALQECSRVIAALVAKEPPAPPVVPPPLPAEHPIQVNIAAAEPPPAPIPTPTPWGEIITVLKRDAEGRTLVARKQILYEAPDASD